MILIFKKISFLEKCLERVSVFVSSKWANEVTGMWLFTDWIYALSVFASSAGYFADLCIATVCFKKKLWWVLQFGCCLYLCKTLSLSLSLYIYIYIYDKVMSTGLFAPGVKQPGLSADHLPPQSQVWL
jgi:hypothetical protein